MIKVEDIEVCGFKQALKGMRNPLNSWERADSVAVSYCGNCPYHVNVFINDKETESQCTANACPEIWLGDNDLSLARRLYKAGTEHRKYLRMIVVYMDILAPFYWWKEFSTYKFGTVANSCSTMHKLASRDLTIDDFSTDHLFFRGEEHLKETIELINQYRREYAESKDKETWWQMIQLLPSSYNQRRTVMMNYEVVMNIINQRANHKLNEWRDFVDVLKGLPYVSEIRGEE